MLSPRTKTCLWLFWINIYIGAFTFGGGYIVVPMIRRYFVALKNLFSEEELLSMAAVAQSTPGAIAVNLCALAGYRSAGFAGAFFSCMGAIIPPLAILSLVSYGYDAFSSNLAVAAVLKGMQAGVAALIVDLVVDMTQMIRRKRSVLLSAIVPGSFLACFVFQVNIPLILAICVLLCVWQARANERRLLP